jgi:hypothetical protein
MKRKSALLWGVALGALFLSSCGADTHEKSNAPCLDPQNCLTPVLESNGSALTSPKQAAPIALSAVFGSYVLEKNHAVTFNVDANYMITTNLAVTINPNRARLMLNLPSKLELDPTTKLYTTKGWVKRYNGLKEEFTLLADSYYEGSLLDVTIKMKVYESDTKFKFTAEDASMSAIATSCGDCGCTGCQCPCPAPCPQPNPCPPPVPTPSPTPCPDEAKDMSFYYHFEKL